MWLSVEVDDLRAEVFGMDHVLLVAPLISVPEHRGIPVLVPFGDLTLYDGGQGRCTVCDTQFSALASMVIIEVLRVSRRSGLSACDVDAVSCLEVVERLGVLRSVSTQLPLPVGPGAMPCGAHASQLVQLRRWDAEVDSP